MKIKNCFVSLSIFIGAFLFQNVLKAQCTGLDADAGPDLFTCDPADMIMLQGAVNGNYTKIMWTPSTGLSSPDVLDPMVTHKTPGTYTYRLTAEGQGNVNLIFNGNFESGNSGFSTEYTFGAPGSPFGPNNYGVGSNPMAYNSGFSPCGDHTSGGGNMMVVDGSTVAGRRVWCQTVPVVVGRDYLFEMYVMNVFPVAPSQISVTVNGNNLAFGSAGALCDWIRIEGCFKATSGTAQICISESSGVGYGNDFAIDDIALFEKCTDFDDVTVEIVDIKANILAPNLPRCASDPFDLFATGSSFGTGITYEWSTDLGRILSTNGMMARVRGTGTYTLKVKYKNGAVECEAEAQFDYQAPDALTGSVRASSKVTCANDTINIRAIMGTGSGNFTYNWSPSGNVLNGQGTDVINVVLPGRYTVTITDELVDCSLILDVDVLADTLRPMISLIGDSLISCLKSEVSLTVSPGDTSKFEITWSDPLNVETYDQSLLKSKLAGAYKVIVTDKNNHCTDSIFWNVVIDTLRPDFELGLDLSIDCVDSIVNVTPLETNPSNAANYFWNLAGTILPTENGLTPKALSSPGKVILRILNTLNGCEAIDSLNIIDLRKIPNLDGGIGDTLTCLKTQVSLSAITNPQDTLFYNWSTVNGNILSGMNTPDIVLNKKAWYYISVLNPTNGCTNLDSVFIDENVQIPVSDAGPDQLFKCQDSLILINAGGSSVGSTFSYEWESLDGQIGAGQNTLLLEARKPGEYTLIVTNLENGCADTSSIMILADQNLPLIQISLPDTISCSITTVTLNANVSSQTGNPLDVLWSSSSGGLITNPDVLLAQVNQPGTYILTSTDPSNGCKSTSSVVVLIDTLKPLVNAGLDLKWNCATQNLMLLGSATAATSSLSFSWSTLDGSIIGNPNIQNIQVGKEGTYILKVTNLINGCEETDLVNIALDTRKPLINILTPDTLTCLKTIVSLNSNGSDQGSNFNYLWSTSNGQILTPATNGVIDVNRPGLYTLTIRDTSNFCESMSSVSVVENIQVPSFLISTPGQLTCATKQVTLNAMTSGLPNQFQIVWFTITGLIQSGANSNLCVVSRPGLYYVKVIDPINGCEKIDSVLVLENTNVPTAVDLFINQAKCSGDIASLQILNIEGGQSPFNLFYDNSPIVNNQLSGMSPGRHLIQVIDANGCIFQQFIDVDTPTVVSLSIIPEVKINFGDNYHFVPTFGTPMDSIAWISWSPSDFLSCNDCREPDAIKPTDDIDYVVTYADMNGCVASAQIKLKIIKRGIWVPNSFSPNGDNVNDFFYPVVSPDSYNSIRQMRIFDRWGNQIFFRENIQPNQPSDGWDGTYKGQLLNPGVYVWMLDLEWKNGEIEKYQGDLSLIR
ncbi:MAG: gliding motility-associated C-terminal domain-containing protein [Saprospiraceae bacterium]|nr:gliding motility-associated C-terminal domain-containing protein [Saprospiraceae bacterium]